MVLADNLPLVVVTDSSRLGRQLKAWAQSKNMLVDGSVHRPWSINRLLREHSPSGHILALYKTLSYWAPSRRFRPRKGSVDGHRSDWKPAPDENKLMDALRELGVSGQVAFPHCSDPKQMKDPAWMEKYNKGLDRGLSRLTFKYSDGAISSAKHTASDSHGGFDNDVLTMNDVLKCILGRKPPVPFTKRTLKY